MKLSDLYPSKYMKAEDFQEGETRTVVIDRVEVELLGKKQEEKPVLYFRQNQKPLVMNKTNAAIIGALYGSETDEWTGKPIVLYTLEVDSFGDIVRAIRVRTKAPSGSRPAAAPKAQPKPTPEPEPEPPTDEAPLFEDEPATPPPAATLEPVPAPFPVDQKPLNIPSHQTIPADQPTLADLIAKYQKHFEDTGRHPSEDQVRRARSQVVVLFHKTAVSDDEELRHGVTRRLFPQLPDEFRGNLHQLTDAELFGLCAWLPSDHAIEAVNRIAVELLANEPQKTAA